MRTSARPPVGSLHARPAAQQSGPTIRVPHNTGIPQGSPNVTTRRQPEKVSSFSGHADEGFLEFETGADRRGGGHLLAAEVFAQAMQAVDEPPQLVVLNACKSQAHLKELVRVVPLAVGMTDSIGDAAALTFAARFYASLTDGQSVLASYRLAKVQMAGSSSSAADADLPVLAHDPVVDPSVVRLVVPHPS